MRKVLYVIDHIGGDQSESFLLKVYKNKKKFKTVMPLFYSLRSTENDPPRTTDLIISSTLKKWGFLAFFELGRIIKREKIEILHLYLTKAILFGVLFKLLSQRNLKIIIHEHGEVFRKKKWYVNFLLFFQNHINLFIAVSKRTKKELIDIGIQNKKIKVVNNFIDFNKFNPADYNITQERKKLGLTKKDLVIGYVGRLIKTKNIDQIIKAIYFLREKNKEQIKLLIIGDGPDKKSLITLTKSLRLDKNIYFLGFRSDIMAIISTTNIGCLVSKTESFGLPILEFLAMNKQMITTNVGIAKEVINFVEIISKKNLAIEIAKAISKLSNSPKILNRDILLSRYSIHNHFLKLNKIYDQL